MLDFSRSAPLTEGTEAWYSEFASETHSKRHCGGSAMVPFAFWIPFWITFVGYPGAFNASQCILNLLKSLAGVGLRSRSHGKDTGSSPVGTTKFSLSFFPFSRNPCRSIASTIGPNQIQNVWLYAPLRSTPGLCAPTSGRPVTGGWDRGFRPRSGRNSGTSW